MSRSVPFHVGIAVAVLAGLVAASPAPSGLSADGDPPLPEAPQYQVTVLAQGPLGFFGPRAINDHGEAVGANYYSVAYPWSRARGVCPTLQSRSLASFADINNAGEVVGSDNHADLYGFLCRDGVVVDVGPSARSLSRANGINEAHQVVGDGELPESQGGRGAFLWQNGVTTRLADFSAAAINERGQVAGTRGQTPATMADVPFSTHPASSASSGRWGARRVLRGT